MQKRRVSGIFATYWSDTEYLRIVDYHRVRWLSLLDCVEAVCAVLPYLVSFFERE